MDFEALSKFLLSNKEWMLSGLSITLLATSFQIIQEFIIKRSKSKVKNNEILKVNNLIVKLNEISKEIDETMLSITDDFRRREEALKQLEKNNTFLKEEEKELKDRVKLLKDIPIEVAEYFQKVNKEHLQSMEKSSSRRDVLIFISGIIITSIVSLLISLLK